jgi:membrane protease YdiL (CAAX protease family)
MDTPPPTDPPPSDVPPEPPILLPASDLPPLIEPAVGDAVVPASWATPPPPLDTRKLLFFGLLAFGAVTYVVLLFVGGLGQRIAFDGLEVLPFLGLALLAYAGERNDVARILCVIYWALLMAAAVAAMSALTGVAMVDVKALAEAVDRTKVGESRPVNPLTVLVPNGFVKTGATIGLCCFATLLSAIGFVPGVRRLTARCIRGFDPDSFVHAVALVTVVGLTIVLFVPVAVTGEPPLLTIIRNFSGVDLGGEGKGLTEQLSDPDVLMDQVFSFVWLVPLGIMVVGWPLYRNLPAALRRVGLVIPESWQPVFGVLVATIMAFLMAGLVDPAIGWFWNRMHWAQTDEKAFEQLFQGVANPLGAVVIAVTAGIGEELFARGILQPRLGIVLSNLFFTSLHAAQYNWDALLSVFIIGLVLGVVRKKTNTTTAAVVHGTYDFLLVMAQIYGFDPSKYFGF